MKKIICLLVMFFGLSSYAQISYCSSDAILQNEIQNNPLVKEQIDIMNERIRQSKKIKDKKDKYSAPTIGTMTIPVVVYIVHNGEPLGESTNISDIQVAAQIEVLSNRFEQHGIKFCLAKKADSGVWATQNKVPYNSATEVQITPGIIHINNPDLSSNTYAEVQSLLSTANPLVKPQKYLRIWVVKSIEHFQSNTLGFAWFPNGASFYKDGIVVLSDVFGGNGVGNLISNYNQGEVLVHEVGHYLGLYHTFEGGCSTSADGPLADGDLVADTPKVEEANFYCIPDTDSCPDSEGPDKIHNYMDYGDNFCTDSFTPGQVERMRDVLNNYRNELVSPENIIYTGTCGSKDFVSAKITPSKYTVCAIDNPILFEALSSNGEPWTYSWNFGDLASGQNISTSQSPTHVFTDAANSPYTVTLTVTGMTNEGMVTVSNSIKIFVTDCEEIRNSETNWYVSNYYNLSFLSGIPKFDTDFPTENYSESSGAMHSSSTGNLLFYTNALDIWDSNHEIVNTEPSLGALTNTLGENVLIIEDPVPENKFYVFKNDTSGETEGETVGEDGLRYNKVNVVGTVVTIVNQNKPITLTSEFGMSPENGFIVSPFDGAVIAINTFTAIKKCDGYWMLVILQKPDEANGPASYVVVFSLTNAGLKYESEYLLPSTINWNVPSYMKASPNGNKVMCYTSNTFFSNPSYIPQNLLVDFNKIDGKINNPKPILRNVIGDQDLLFGACFSPNSQLLYLSEAMSGISQYNINTRSINASKKVVGNNSFNRDIKQGPDNKLYISGQDDRLAVIHNPNNLATTTNSNSCNFSKYGPARIADVGLNLIFSRLPNFIDAKKETAYFSSGPEVISAYVEGCNKYRFFPNYDNSANCNFTFKWVINHTTDLTIPEATYSEETPFHQFNASAPGVYQITLYYNSIPVGTMNITVAAIVPPTITGSVAACATGENTITSNSVPLSALSAGQTVFWEVTAGVGTIVNPPNTNPNFDILWTELPGEIKVTVTDVNGCPASSTRTIDRICCDCLENLLWEATVPSNGLARDFILNEPGTTGCSGYNLKYNWYQKNGVILINTTGYSDYYDATQSIQSPIKPGGVRVDVLNSNGNVTCSRTFGIFPANRLINSDSENQKYYPQVYPNPSNGIYNIRIENFTGKIAFQIFDLNGRLIFDINDDQFENERAIDLRNLQSGIYIIKIIGNEINYSHKLIKN